MRAQQKSPPATASPAGEVHSAAKSKHREATAFASIMALLRAGKLDAAREELVRLARRDPAAFFELLERLPGMPGLEDAITTAAAGLPWHDPAVRAMLNRIGAHKWRDLAWRGYIDARVGVVPDEEVLAVASKARVQVSLSHIEGLLEDAAGKRPREFFAMLNRRGGTSIREDFVERVMKFQPELGRELFATIPDGSPGCNYDRPYVLQARARLVPTAQNLREVMDDTGTRGPYSSDFAFLFASYAYTKGTPEERGKVLDYIASLPNLARNRMLCGPIYSSDKEAMPAAEFIPLLGMFTSGFLQQEALGAWLEKQPALDPADRAWVAGLPTEKLKFKANQLLDARAEPKDKR
jgi:hypothetical protein